MNLFKPIFILLVFLISCDNDFKKNDESYEIDVVSKKKELDFLNHSIINLKDSIRLIKQGFQIEEESYFNNLLMSERFKYSKLKIHNIDTSSFKPYKIIELTLFDYSENARPNNYQGSGVIIIDESAKYNKYVWSYIDYNSDYPPHTFSFIDFNNDGKKDLFVYAGFEDVFMSELFLNQISLNCNNPFKLVYRNSNAYSTLIDINNDGIPEILNPIYKVESEYEEYINEYEYGNNTTDFINVEYDRVVGEFDKYNFDYNMPNYYKGISLKLLNKVSILSIENDTILDVSANYPEHFNFRIEALKSFKNLSNKMRIQIDSLIMESKIITEKK